MCLSKGHITKVYSIKGGAINNLPGFRLIRFSCIQNKPFKQNPIGRNTDKFLSPPPPLNRVHFRDMALSSLTVHNFEIVFHGI